jgi:NAD(P)-dependent dehydrogenase (short-subunit alcohol dehydrogenase family)
MTTMSAYRVLVTGSSSGFGKLTAETLARAGHHVFAGMRAPHDRNVKARDELLMKAGDTPGSIDVVELDVTNDASVEAAIAHISGGDGGLDVVVNNAGIAGIGIMEGFTMDQARTLFETNVLGVLRVNRAALPLMRSRQSGLLVHVSSTLGRYVMPFLGIYTATKFALEALADAYRYELAPLGIESVIIQPGTFPTTMVSTMQSPADSSRAVGYGAQNERLANMGAGLAAAMSGEGAPNPQDVADAILRVITAPPGQRPVRTVVDKQGGAAVEAINQFTDGVQRQIFDAMGFADLFTPNVKR